MLMMTLLALGKEPAAAQDVRRESRPELDIYINQGSRVRIILEDALNQSEAADYSQGKFSYFVEIALRPVFRRELRQQPDVFRNRYLTFRGGYEYLTSLTGSTASSENRVILEAAARYPLPLGLVLRDRNRGEFRMPHGQGLSNRYRNRLWLERDIKLSSLAFTPYLYDEIYYDTRYHALSANRQAFGLQFPAKSRLVLEPYLLHQKNNYSSPRQVYALGFKISIFF